MSSAEPRVGAVQRLARRIRERGVTATLRKAWSDHVFRRSTSVIVEYHPDQRPLGPNDQTGTGLSFAELRAGDAVPPLCAWMAYRAADFAAMLTQGKIGVFALRNGVAIGCAWIALDDHHDPLSREHYAVGPKEAYHYCWMVDPAQRRTNVGISLCREVLRLLASMGIERQFGVVDVVNRASYLIQYRFGYRECGRKVLHYHLLGMRWTRYGRYQGTLGPAPRGRA
ncbi:MAG TPA: GNAT family N-acetyltransferase [Sphingomonas sp.]|uniref:GNAT family N-acetyltransferase n=1 Tax=Sphingomonas sp. TaxID=28214 RepID=UPI002EDA7E77